MNERTPIKVLVVDDHPIIRHGIKAMLFTFDDILVVGEAGSGMETLARCQETNPDVILMDVVMPGMNGVETTRAVLKRFPQVKIIMLTSFPGQDLVQETLEAGAIGFLLKDAPIDMLGDAIRSAYIGHSTLAPEATQALIQSKSRPPKLGHDLSDREREVLALVVAGLSNEAIADRLVISVNTVRKHVSACMSKLEARNRAQVAAQAVRHHIVS
jgi:NarL family two-component system response regulator LiaR